jgi:pimeloyl-ACP methyl ester carboxylesterase
MLRGFLRIIVPIIGILLIGEYLYSAAQKNPSILDVLSSETVEASTQTYLNMQSKYLKGGKLEYVTFSAQEAEDSEKMLARHGILYIRPNARGTVLVCHGFMCDKFDISFLRRTLFEDYNVMMFDFRAHGENVDNEQCCTFGRDEALDVIGAVNYLKSRKDIKDLPRIVYGFSMGAVAAIQAQATDQTLFSAMILDCPYDTSENVIKRSLENLKFTLFGYTFEMPGKALLEKFAFNSYVQSFLKALLKTVASLDATATRTQIFPLSPVESIRKISIPCLFIHCKNDEKVPVLAAQKLYENAQGFKRLWITNGRRHFDSIFYNPEKYVHKVNRFIDYVLSANSNQKPFSKIYTDIKL